MYKLRTILVFFLLANLLLANPFTVSNKNVSVLNERTFLNQKTIVQQRELREKIAKTLKSIQSGENKIVYFNLLLISFLYGLFHAAGPGHRKAVVFAAFLSRRSHFWEPALAGILLAGLHVLVSVFLVFGVYFLLGKVIGSAIDKTSAHLDWLTLFLLFVFISWLLFKKLKKMVSRNKIIGEEKIDTNNVYTTMIISGLVPCPGATLILIFAISLKMYWEGIMAVVAMSLGMGITIAIAGYLAYFGQTVIFSMLKNNKQKITILADFLEVGGYIIILLFSLFFFLSFTLF